MNNEGQAPSLERIAQGEDTAKRVNSSFLSGADDRDNSIDGLLVGETSFEVGSEIVKVYTSLVVCCYTDNMIGSESADS